MHCLIFSSKAIVVYGLSSKIRERAAEMAAMKASKTRPWDSISGWEHTNSFAKNVEDYKNVTKRKVKKSISQGCMESLSSNCTNKGMNKMEWGEAKLKLFIAYN